MNEIYKEIYLNLFNRVTDAIREIELLNFGAAREILIRAQQNAEEKYLNSKEQ